MLLDVEGEGGVSECSGHSLFSIKEKGIYTMARHHSNNKLLARNLLFPFHSEVRQ